MDLKSQCSCGDIGDGDKKTTEACGLAILEYNSVKKRPHCKHG